MLPVTELESLLKEKDIQLSVSQKRHAGEKSGYIRSVKNMKTVCGDVCDEGNQIDADDSITITERWSPNFFKGKVSGSEMGGGTGKEDIFVKITSRESSIRSEFLLEW